MSLRDTLQAALVALSGLTMTGCVTEVDDVEITVEVEPPLPASFTRGEIRMVEGTAAQVRIVAFSGEEALKGGVDVFITNTEILLALDRAPSEDPEARGAHFVLEALSEGRTKLSVSTPEATGFVDIPVVVVVSPESL